MFQLSRFPERLQIFEHGGRYYLVFLKKETGAPARLELTSPQFGDGPETWAWQWDGVFHVFANAEMPGSIASRKYYGQGPTLPEAWQAANESKIYRDTQLPTAVRRIVASLSVTYVVSGVTERDVIPRARKLVADGYFSSLAEAVEYISLWREHRLPYSHYAPSNYTPPLDR